MKISIHRKLFPINGTNCSDYCSGDPFAGFYNPYPYYSPPPPQFDQSSLAGTGEENSDDVSPSVIVLFVLLSTLLLLLLYYIVVAKSCLGLCRTRARRSSDDIEAGEQQEDETSALENHHHHHPIWLIATTGLNQTVINSIAVAKFRKGDTLIDGSDCSVCLSEFRDGESVRLLPKCSHAFHVACIDTWLRSHTNCPLCRSDIVAPAILPEEENIGGNSDDISAEEESESTVNSVRGGVVLGRSVSMDHGVMVNGGQRREEKLSKMVMKKKKRSLSCGGIRFLSSSMRFSDGDSQLRLDSVLPL